MSEADPHYLTLIEAGRMIRSGAISPVELTEAILTRIERLDGKLHAYARLMTESAMAQAKQAEAELVSGNDRGPLHGVPLGIKEFPAYP